MKIIQNRVDTVFIHVSDLKSSVRWYCDLFGIEQIPVEKLSGHIYTLNMGEGRPGITFDDHSQDEGYHFIPSNQALMNFSTADIHKAYEHVKEIGGEMITEIITHPDLEEFSFKDPDGNILMVCSCFT